MRTSSLVYFFNFFSLFGLLVERPSVEMGHPLADKCREFTRQTGIDVEAVTPALTGGWDRRVTDDEIAV